MTFVADAASLGPAPPPARETNAAAAEAARQFETVLLGQLLSILRKTAPNAGTMGGSMGATTYVQMFDDAIAEQLAAAGGVGLSATIARALGAEETGTTGTTHGVAAPALSPGGPVVPHGPPLAGLGRRLQATADALMRGGAAERWSRAGSLEPDDLRSAIATEEPGGLARFNVRDARGYQGYYKCNLFALELARRAGFSVPVIGRARGWGFPAPNRLARDAADGRLEGGWASVATGEDAAALDRDVRRGARAFALVGEATGERAGHMAVIERVHEVRYGDDGRVDRIVFSGWEARERGAQHLTRRTWNRVGHPGGTQARNGFERIEILQLRQAAGAPEVRLSTRAGVSELDRPSSPPEDHPNYMSED